MNRVVGRNRLGILAVVLSLLNMSESPLKLNRMIDKLPVMEVFPRWSPFNDKPEAGVVACNGIYVMLSLYGQPRLDVGDFCI